MPPAAAAWALVVTACTFLGSWDMFAALAVCDRPFARVADPDCSRELQNYLQLETSRDAGAVLIIDPEKKTADRSTLGVPAGAGKWIGGVLAPDGRIYAIPRSADNVMIIDPGADAPLCESVVLSAHFNKL